MQSSSSFSFPRHPVALLAAVALLIAGVLLALYAWAARSWYEQPFPGVLPLRDLEISSARSLTGEEWDAPMMGLLPGDQINAVAGVTMGDLPLDERVESYRDAILSTAVGARVPLQAVALAPEAAAPEGSRADTLLVEATVALARGLPWRASAMLAPLVADRGHRTPDAVLLAATAASRWR